MYCDWGGANFWFPIWPLFWFVILIISGIAVWKIISSRSAKINSGLSCYQCNNSIEYSYMRCPYCGTELKGHCPECSGIIENTWDYCASCGTTLQKDKTSQIE